MLDRRKKKNIVCVCMCVCEHTLPEHKFFKWGNNIGCCLSLVYHSTVVTFHDSVMNVEMRLNHLLHIYNPLDM